MIVLGLDPGLANLGWCILARGEPIAGGVFHTEASKAAPSRGADKMRRADEIGAFLSSTIDVFRVGLVAHEGISLGFHQATTLLDMGIAFGVLAAACAERGVRRVEVTTGEIKLWALARRLTPGPRATEEERLRARVEELEAGNKGPVIGAVRELWPALAAVVKGSDLQHLADATVAAVLAAAKSGEGMPGSNAGLCAQARRYPAAALSTQLLEKLPPLPKRKRGEPVPSYLPAEVYRAAWDLVKP